MNNKELQKKVLELERQVKELLEWKKAREIQQLKYPLDEISRTIITNTNG